MARLQCFTARKEDNSKELINIYFHKDKCTDIIVPKHHDTNQQACITCRQVTRTSHFVERKFSEQYRYGEDITL
jgi:hypothetical protein